jgi:dimethylhistidine N-methyltransferase
VAPIVQRALRRNVEETSQSSFAQDVLAGLTAPRKTLSPKYFYDGEGSRLFEAITQLPEYYPTRTEIGILEEHGRAIAQYIPAGGALVEFGAGSSAKIRAILRALDKLAVYVPVDISAEFLAGQAAMLQRDFPRLQVRPVAADFTEAFALPREARLRPRIGFFPGSTIGNFDPPEAENFLRHAGRILGPAARMIVGVDLVKDRSVLHAAYNDAQGVTAAFNLNLLARINRELGGEFDLARFEHRAFFNDEVSRIEMHLVSRARQRVQVCGHAINFDEGETIHTECSYKYTIDTFADLAARAGWQRLKSWTDARDDFSVHVLALI